MNLSDFLTMRHEVLLTALRVALPELSPRPARAGLHLYLPLLPGQSEVIFLARAAEQGLGLSGAAAFGGLNHPPAVLLGFAHLGPEALRDGANRLAAAFRVS